jgi:hypothetical protein
VGTPCHTANVNPIVHFCPDSLQHVPVYGCHSDDDALSQFLKIIWQGWYVDDVLDIPPEKEVARCEVIAVVATINWDMLERDWTEMDYRIDVCRVTLGSHTECL